MQKIFLFNVVWFATSKGISQSKGVNAEGRGGRVILHPFIYSISGSFSVLELANFHVDGVNQRN